MIKRLVRSWGWVFLIHALCFLGYFTNVSKKELVYTSLKHRKDEYFTLKEKALQENERLKAEIASQSDPLWIEMVLKKKLGLVPNGNKKIYFETERSF